MKKIVATLVLLLLTATPTFAHYIWLETNRTGNLNEQQEVRVYYGEYTYGVIEQVKGENFPAVSKFKLWVFQPDGTKIALNTDAKENHYVGYFTPRVAGTYTVSLNNTEIDVLDYTQWDFGIFKPQYHSTARVQVGKTTSDTVDSNEKGIVITELTSENDLIVLQVLYQGVPLAKNELKIYVADLWVKTLETDEKGTVRFSLPWNTKYTMETTFEERVPGRYNGKDYEFIWHCATYCIN